jgi:hypothetical protein
MPASGPSWDGAGDPPAWHPVGRIDLARLSPTAKAQAVLAFLLFLSLQLPWYTSSASGVSGSASAMVAGGWRWLIWLLSLATAVYVALGAVTSWHEPAFMVRRRLQVLIGVGALDVLLVLIAAFGTKAHPPSVLPFSSAAAVGTGVGAVLGLLLALGVLAVAVLDLINASPRAATSGIAGRRGAVPGEDDVPTRVVGDVAAASRSADPLRIPPADPAPPAPRPAGSGGYPPQRPAEPGSGPPTGWMPPQPPPPPPL